MNNKVKLTGKVAQFPTDTPVHKAYNFLENTDNLPKSRIWYIMVEKTGDSVQIARYYPTKGQDLDIIYNKLSERYKDMAKDEPNLLEAISMIETECTDKFAFIKNVPPVLINGKKLSSIIMEDLIKILE